MGDADDVGPDGVEAEAQREETVVPWIWGAVGLLVIVVFVLWATLWHGPKPPHPQPQMPAPGAAPVRTP